jgi:DNA polymerase-3 subunit epsilon
MNLKQRSWLFFIAGVLLVIVLTIGATLIFHYQLTPAERDVFEHLSPHQAILLLLPPILVLVAATIAFSWVLKNDILPLQKIVEETRILSTVNSTHRLNIEGSKTIRQLCEVINYTGDLFEDFQSNLEEKIAKAREDVEEERNILVALISELSEGIIVCNLEGQILLYNNRIQRFFGSENGEGANSSHPDFDGFIGLGRSIFGIIDKNIVTHALGDLTQRLQRESSKKVSQFVISGASSQLLRVQMVPVLGDERNLTGFILVIYDITRQVEIDSYRDYMLQSLTEGIRSSLGSIRAAIETIMDHPHMNEDQKGQFCKIIKEEALSLSTLIERSVADFSGHFKSHWSREDMLIEHLLYAIQRIAGGQFNIAIEPDPSLPEIWVRVDSYTIVEAVLFLINELHEYYNIRELDLRAGTQKNFASIDLKWQGKLVSFETLNIWKSRVMVSGHDGAPFTLQEVLEQHDAEIWSKNEELSENAYLRILLPSVTPSKETFPQIRVVREERPEFYDFDLFHQAGQKPELDKQLLSALDYTVFDTETTGLDPSDGDEIISIGAVRIYNGKLLRKEIFDQLVNPQRTVPPESVKIHGIEPELLQIQPLITKVLPGFHRFAEDSILVAHNAAFDMQFLTLKEDAAGVKFINPVLDTLLLSAVVHPNQERHSLDAIASRLGINVFGRHTALGDAFVTAEILIKLIPLLEQQGIFTLKEAREASQKTFYARIKY